jgi:hypothetical protein
VHKKGKEVFLQSPSTLQSARSLFFGIHKGNSLFGRTQTSFTRRNYCAVTPVSLNPNIVTQVVVQDRAVRNRDALQAAMAGELGASLGLATGRKDWEDPTFFGWNKRNAHVPLHSHNDEDSALKFWLNRSKATKDDAAMALWDDEVLPEAVKSARNWTSDVPHAISLSGDWKFHLAPRPEEVPKEFFDPSFDDGSWGGLTGKHKLWLCHLAVDQQQFTIITHLPPVDIGILIAIWQLHQLPGVWSTPEG